MRFAIGAYFLRLNFPSHGRLCDVVRAPALRMEKFTGYSEVAPWVSTGIGDDRDR
jgi:hypothetical protein